MTATAPEIDEARPTPARAKHAASGGIGMGPVVAVVTIVLGFAGWLTSLLLNFEYIAQLRHVAPPINCTLSPVVSCVPNLTSPAGNLLGFSNSLIGITAFMAPMVVGVASLFGARMGVWFWRCYELGLLAALVLVHSFAYLSVFVFGEICPWCVVVWLSTIPLFWVTTSWALRSGVWGAATERAGAVLLRWSVPIVLIDYLLIAVCAQLKLSIIQSLL